MGQTYVYNLGSFEDTESKDIFLEIGLFFDGTKNNHRNTEIRKKIQKIDEYADQTKPKNVATQREKEIYNQYGLESTYKNMWSKKVEKDNSFSNDFSNVARLWRGCKKDYKIYIEGIGTEEEQDDNTIGLALGQGDTGIRAKVRKGCKELVKKIDTEVKKIKKEKKEIGFINLTLDVFGFSRGAAAARNFIYEVNGTKRQQDQKIVSLTKYESYGVGPSFSTRAKEVYYDKDGHRVAPAYLNNGRMPSMGYLGYYLLENGLTKEELRKINLKIRFVGLYDTVASYGVYHKNDVEQLQLNNLGNPSKVVHFTAMDEHRENFALTRINHNGVIFIEKAFPGVHSDVGGGYNTGTEIVDEIETSNHNTNLEAVKRKLIKEYWYKNEQLEIKGKNKNKIASVVNPASTIVLYQKLTGTRFLKKEYSYIPLHFMEEFFREALLTQEEHIFQPSIKMENEYSISNDSILVKAKNHLKKYVFEDEKVWEFIPDTIKKIDIYDNTPKTEKEKWYEENFSVKRDKTYVSTRMDKQIAIQPQQEDQKVLRELRRKYLHWSADRDWVGMDPRIINGERKRQEFSK
ncbi:T6SS phospholipase effector Tle1-like catalytic domain-containing protein [Capnocytophaga canis]|uniref:T6SS phospholipase effector Tle1-like catalytic domain-containing protein n=1 Tax=Capnocytophaga canis TaxID=1848903 RepID=UPI0037CF89E7